MQKVITSFFLSIFCLFSLGAQQAFAASTTIGISPQSGSFGKPFTVNLVIDGHGDHFNAAQATVMLSSNLAVKDLALGDCNFAFFKTPTIESPSFKGIILKTYATKCTAYKLTLVPTAKGKSTITLSKASVKRYGDGVEMLTSVQNGSYILTGASKKPSVLGAQTSSLQEGLYAVTLKVFSSEKTPARSARVILNSVSAKKQLQATTDSNGAVHFSNLQPGIYDAVVKQNNAKVGETIINVNGSNHILAFTINLEAQKNNPLVKNTKSLFQGISTGPLFSVGALIVGMLAGVGASVVVMRRKGRHL